MKKYTEIFKLIDNTFKNDITAFRMKRTIDKWKD